MTQTWTIRLGHEAEKDFARILKDTKDTFGPKQAETYKQTLRESLIALAGEGPNMLGSAASDDILPNLRTLHVARRGRRGRHFIMYRAGRENAVEVIRILHDAMDLARHIPPTLPSRFRYGAANGLARQFHDHPATDVQGFGLPLTLP